jgi:N-acetylneuraminate synthase
MDPARSDSGAIAVGGRWISSETRPFLIAEIGVNHMGSSALAIQMAGSAHRAGFDMVKLQLRTPELSVPPACWNELRPTPWGELPQIEYRRRVELSAPALAEFDAYCRRNGIPWTASCWDPPAFERLLPFSPPAIKVPSARLRHGGLLDAIRECGNVPVIVSTGMADLAVVHEAVQRLADAPVLLAHTVSAYPNAPLDMNLRAIHTLRAAFPGRPVGYSSHHGHVWPSCVAVALGASFVEQHVTAARSLVGSDQTSSIELDGLPAYTAALHDVYRSLGNGIKRVMDAERPAIARLSYLHEPA